MQGGRDRGPKGRKRGRGPHLSPAATSAGLSTLPTTQPYLAQHLLLKSCQRKTHTQKSGFSPKPLTSSNCSFRSPTTESERKWWEAGPRGSRLGPRRSGTDRSFQRPPTCSRTRPRGLGEHGRAPSAGGWARRPPGRRLEPQPLAWGRGTATAVHPPMPPAPARLGEAGLGTTCGGRVCSANQQCQQSDRGPFTQLKRTAIDACRGARRTPGRGHALPSALPEHSECVARSDRTVGVAARPLLG